MQWTFELSLVPNSRYPLGKALRGDVRRRAIPGQLAPVPHDPLLLLAVPALAAQVVRRAADSRGGRRGSAGRPVRPGARTNSSAGGRPRARRRERSRPTCCLAPLGRLIGHSRRPAAWHERAGCLVGSSARPGRQRSSSVAPQTRPHRIRCKSAPHGGAREMWRRGSGVHMRSRGRNAATAAGGAWVGPNWWRSAVELRSFARRDHLVVELAARRRAGHAPLSQGGCPRWALLAVAPRCGVGGCCGSAARATEARAPRRNPIGGPSRVRKPPLVHFPGSGQNLTGVSLQTTIQQKE